VIRYIELNPVRAAMTASPQDYRWSSVYTHFGLAWDPLITLHPLSLALGSVPDDRRRAYQMRCGCRQGWLTTTWSASDNM